MIIEYIKKYGMLRPEDRVLCAVSGGADSMCLLSWLHDNAQTLGITVAAAHFNHCLRGEESDRDEEFVKDFCRREGISFACGRGDVAALARDSGRSTEDAARAMRYDFLRSAAKKTGCNKIATAHNAEDNAETMLLNLVRGAGARGLAGIPPVRDEFIRPLLSTTRAEILSYLNDRGICYVTDSTNLDDDYTRNKLRHRVMPVLSELNPSFAAGCLRTAESLRDDDACLYFIARGFAEENYIDDSLPAEKLAALPRAVAVRVLRIVCGSGLTAVQTDAILALLKSPENKFVDVRGMRIARDRDKLLFGTAAKKLGSYVIPINGGIDIPEAGIRISGEIIENCKQIDNIHNFDFKYSGICGSISLTPRQDGDRIRLRGRGCTKSLKELLRERNVPVVRRDMIPVLRDRNGPIAVLGMGMDERVAAEPGDTVLRVKINIINCTGENEKDEK